MSDDGEIWVSQTDLAKLKGVSKVAIGKRMRRLAAEGLVTVREHKGRSLVRLAEWDRATGEGTDPARLEALVEGGGAMPAERLPPTPPLAGEPGLTAARTITERYRGALAKIDYEERCRQLLAVEDVTEAMVDLATALGRALDQVAGCAEEVMAAGATGGPEAAREVIKRALREARERLAAAVQAAKDVKLAGADDEAAATGDALVKLQ